MGVILFPVLILPSERTLSLAKTSHEIQVIDESYALSMNTTVLFDKKIFFLSIKGQSMASRKAKKMKALLTLQERQIRMKMIHIYILW